MLGIQLREAMAFSRNSAFLMMNLWLNLLPAH
jgi:hypothetical protein